MEDWGGSEDWGGLEDWGGTGEWGGMEDWGGTGEWGGGKSGRGDVDSEVQPARPPLLHLKRYEKC